MALSAGASLFITQHCHSIKATHWHMPA